MSSSTSLTQTTINRDLPFIFLADIIPLGKVDKICDRFGRKKRKTIYDVNLRAMVTLVSWSFERSKRRLECSEIRISQRHIGALLPPRRAGLDSSNMLFVIKQ